MKFSKNPLAQTLTQLCFAKEVNHVVICPGSRNAPLTIGFTENPHFKVYSIVDERCAAFFALGLALQLQHPVAVVCTSGSAVLNFYPAIAEAFYSDIPLVIISADRPPQYIDIGDGQTIRQENVFQNHILYSANLKDGEENSIDNETQINIAINLAIELKGPVHINVPFEEPLYGQTDDLKVRPQHVPARTSPSKPLEDYNEFLEQWNTAERKLILVGVLHPDSIEKKWVDSLAQDKSVLVLTETTSNLYHNTFINAIDQLIAPLDVEEISRLQPDVLLTIGGMVVSKKIKAFLRTYKPGSHWHVDEKKAYDTYFSLTKHFKVSPNTFFEHFLPHTVPVESDYRQHWLQVRELRRTKHTAYLSNIGFSDFKACEIIFNSLPDDTMLHLANSATIRYAQLFELKPNLQVFCNRGTSGIDGSTSTAVGFAITSHKPVTLITGDLSFFYDSNALWNNYIPNTFRIVVINNSGGGIFRILPGHKNTPNFDTYFETVHSLTAKQLCEMYGFEYSFASAEGELKDEIKSFYNPSDKPKLLEVFTPRKQNDTILLEYFEAVK